MDFGFTAEQEAFRKEVRDFLEEEMKKGTFQPKADACVGGISPEFSRKVGQKGWIGLAWPREAGGQERGHVERLVYLEEMLRYGAPTAAHHVTHRQVGASIIAFGTPEQKKRFMPGILKGETIFSLGLSEPDAGSDLFALKTSAKKVGNEYILNGQKTWIGYAHAAHYVFVLARTDPRATKREGLSQLIVDLHLPGVTVRPVMGMCGFHEYHDIFFDDVHVPADCLLGQENRGAQQMSTVVVRERMDLDRLMANYTLFPAVIKYAQETRRDGRPLIEDPIIRDKLAQLAVEFEVGRLLCYKAAWMLDKKLDALIAVNESQLASTLFEQHLSKVALQILGPYSQLMPGSPEAPLDGEVALNYPWAFGYGIAGGTHQILRRTIAMVGLGMPKD